MVKLVHLLRRRAEVSRADFQAWWETSHAPLMRQQQPARGKARYVQLRTLTPAGTPWADETPYDGISESWYESLEEKLRLDGSPAGVEARRLGRADHAPYIDPEASALQIQTTEHVVFGPSGPEAGPPESRRLVLVDCFAAAPGVTAAEAGDWWLREHGPRVAELADVPGFLAYTQSRADATWARQTVEGGGAEPFVGFAESTWASLEALTSAWPSPEWGSRSAAICDHLDRYRDPSRSLRFLTEEYVVIDGARAPPRRLDGA